MPLLIGHVQDFQKAAGLIPQTPDPKGERVVMAMVFSDAESHEDSHAH